MVSALTVEIYSTPNTVFAILNVRVLRAKA